MKDNQLKDIQTFIHNKKLKLDTNFYKKCEEVLNDSTENLDSRLFENRYFVESLRLFMLDNFDKFYFYLADSINFDLNEKYLIRDLNFDHSTRYNLLKQLHVLETNNLDTFLLDLPDSYNLCKYFIISDHDLNLDFKLTNKLSLNLFLCTNYEFLKHQNVDRFAQYLQSTDPYVVKSVNMFKDIHTLFNKIRTTDSDTYDRLMLFSGFVLHTLGTTYTSDADTMYLAKDLPKSKIDEINELFDSNEKIECFVYTESDDNIDYISELFTDPDKHYYFLGLKIIGIKNHIKRLYRRASPSSFVDLIMLNKINNIEVQPCIPPITIDENNVTVYDKKQTLTKLLTTQKYFKSWHNLNYSIDELKKLIPRCQNYPNDPPFYRSIKIDPVTIKIDYILHSTVRKLMNKHLKKGSLLLIDDAKEYPRFSKLSTDSLIIEPIDAPLSESFLELEKKNNKSRIKLVDYKNLDIDRSFDNVLINYSLSLLDTNNLEKTLKRINADSILIIHIDNEVVKKILEKANRYELFDSNNKTIVGVYRYDEKIIVYLRETLRFGSGKIETILNTDLNLNLDNYTFDTGSFNNVLIDDPIITKTLALFRYSVFHKK